MLCFTENIAYEIKIIKIKLSGRNSVNVNIVDSVFNDTY